MLYIWSSGRPAGMEKKKTILTEGKNRQMIILLAIMFSQSRVMISRCCSQLLRCFVPIYRRNYQNFQPINRRDCLAGFFHFICCHVLVVLPLYQPVKLSNVHRDLVVRTGHNRLINRLLFPFPPHHRTRPPSVSQYSAIYRGNHYVTRLIVGQHWKPRKPPMQIWKRTSSSFLTRIIYLIGTSNNLSEVPIRTICDYENKVHWSMFTNKLQAC